MDCKHINRCGKWLSHILSVTAGITLAVCCGTAAGQNPAGNSVIRDGQIMEVPVGSFMAAWKVSLPLAEEQIIRISLSEDKAFVLTSGGRLFWIDRVDRSDRYDVTDLLTEEQKTQLLDKLVAANAGGAGIAPMIQKRAQELGLTTDQKERLTKLGTDMQDKIAKVRETAGSDRQALTEALRTTIQEMQGKFREVLAPDRRASGVIRAITRVAEKGEKIHDPVTLSNRVVVPTEKNLVVFDLKGKLSHTIKLRYNASTGAVGEGNAVFMGVDHPLQGRVQAVDTKVQPYDISPIWELATGGQMKSRPAVFQGAVFAASRDGCVYGVRAENRDVLWPVLDGSVFRTGAEIVANLAADKDGLYIASTDTKLYCLNGSTGRIKWIYYSAVSLKEESAPVSVGSFVYLYVPGKGLVAIDKTGLAELRQPKWTLEDARQVLSVDEKNTYVRMTDNSIAGVDRATGQIKMRSARKDFVTFASNVNFKELGTIYAATTNGVVMAIKPVTKPGAVGEWVVAPAEPNPLAGR